MNATARYVLIAISNSARGAAFRQLAADALGLDPVVVRDGEDAVQEMSRRGMPALLIVDLSLSRVDGFAVIRKIRRQATDADTRIIVVAAHEALRAAARELSTTLAIASILPLDVEEESLRDILAAEFESLLTDNHKGSAAGPAPATARPARAGDAEEVLDRAASEARRRFRLPISIGYLRIGDDEHLTYQLGGKDPEPALALAEVSDFRFLGPIADGLDPLIIPNVENHPVYAHYLARGPRPVRGFAAVPITISRGHARGALCVLDVQPLTLTATDVDALAALGRSVGLELDRVLAPAMNDLPASELNAEDVKALQYLASTDPLTGLANRRGGEKHIANEISRAKRERRPLSCLLLDVDRFKLVNDTYGHQAGDQLLHDLGTLLRRTVRAYDILVRWGGEEFLVVLPGVDQPAAFQLAERIRLAVEGMDNGAIGTVTISAGVARFEADYDFASTLKTADQRLYQAKAAGRNCVI